VRQLDKLIQNYNIDNFRDEIIEEIDETKDEAEYENQSKKRMIEEVLALVAKMQEHHQDSMEKPVDEVIAACFKAYGFHLEDLEKKDIAALKKRIGDLNGMKNNLVRDLREADQ
jgi:chemotaxis regulatin CheY-phosphate phosphatase CheZ